MKIGGEMEKTQQGGFLLKMLLLSFLKNLEIYLYFFLFKNKKLKIK
jgi:hypothetical protein